MAAILCDSIGKMCNALSQGCTRLGRIPASICGGTWKYITNAFDGNFCIYTTAALGTSIPVIIISLTTFFQSNVINCPQSTWIIVNGFLSSINVLAAIYISNEIEQSNTPSEPQANHTLIHAQVEAYETTAIATDGKTGEKLPLAQAVPSHAYDEPNMSASLIPTTPNQNGNPGSMARLKHVLCYDSKVALYIVVVVFFIIWQFYGVFQMFGKDRLNIVNCPRLLDGQVFTCLLLGYAFIFAGGCAFTCSVCCNVTNRRP